MTAAGNNVPTYSLSCTNKKYIKITMNRFELYKQKTYQMPMKHDANNDYLMKMNEHLLPTFYNFHFHSQSRHILLKKRNWYIPIADKEKWRRM